MIVLTVCVDCDTAPALNAGQDTIEDILVLHLEGGKDFFISQQTALGREREEGGREGEGRRREGGRGKKEGGREGEGRRREGGRGREGRRGNAGVEFECVCSAWTAPRTICSHVVSPKNPLNSPHISISGNYIVSCFGSSLEALVHLHTYIREVPVADLLDISLTASWDTCTLPQQSSSSSSSSPRPPSPSTQHILQTTPALDLPKELFRMVDFLTKHGMKEVREVGGKERWRDGRRGGGRVWLEE